ncbi:unnamed protein product [Rotaria sordida]|uniref:Uncharacterized protein n=1 Tax=Rotaria sordida TaxID=392033 RepID=A0A814SLK4_9BILA|nr:unnamed protein product [Rotaria sordida]CAF1386054.1 unnamed protein product [Rotaria sordida]
MTTIATTSSWENLIEKRINDVNFKSRTCKIYNRQAGESDQHSDKLCPCDRLVRRHSFKEKSVQEIEKLINPDWQPPDEYDISAHSAKVPVTVFGRLKSNGCKFLRIDTRTKEEVIYELLVDDCGGKKFKPSLILSIYGGAKYFTMTEKLEIEIIRGISDATTSANAWVLTAGINNGVSKSVGEAISHYGLFGDYPKKVTCIGLTMWGTMNESTRFELKYSTKDYQRDLLYRQIPDHLEEDKETIEKNHTHCILFDSGQLNEYLDDSHRHKLVTHACTQDHTCHAVTLIIEGGVNTLEVITNDIDAQRPIVLIQGSGRLADMLAKLIEQTSNFEQNQLSNPEQRRRDEDILVDLAIEWNYLDGVLPILQSRKYLQMKKKQELITNDITCEKELFKKCLEKNRPAFIQYFLMSGFDPLTLINNNGISSYQTIILDFYKYSHYHMTKRHADRVETLFGEPSKITLEKLDEKLNKFVGAFIKPIYSAANHDCIRRIKIDMKLHLCAYCGSEKHDFEQPDDQIKSVDNHNNQVENNVSNYTKDEFLRDLFLWSIFMDMPEMAKIFLVHLPSRICAALIASAIFKRYSKASTTIHMEEKFQNQSLEFEEIAVRFIDKCYEYNERLACELLLREVPLFGNVTCMQVAISSECGKLVGTHCFDQTVNQVWCNKLSITNQQTSAKPSLLFSILSFGLLAPIYMMLYHLDSPSTFTIPHWTEIYVIVTILTMSCEEVRKLYHEYKKRMIERWGSIGSSIVIDLTTIAAYGVVSRALICYKQVPFTFNKILREMFYEPYWFIYGEFSDKELLDDKINNDTSSVVTEATATQFLLAFHMLFINILILNLLIAVFTYTIDKVQENTEFHWRYQRYAFVREYFERPLLAYPPLIIIPHIIIVCRALLRRCCPKLCQNRVFGKNHQSKSRHMTLVFKMIPTNTIQQNDRWNAFESAATRNETRSIIAQNKTKNVLTTDDMYSKSTMDTTESDVMKPSSDQQQMIQNLNIELSTMKSVLNNNQRNIKQVTSGPSCITNPVDYFQLF